jgi:hypothetical protein
MFPRNSRSVSTQNHFGPGFFVEEQVILFYISSDARDSPLSNRARDLLFSKIKANSFGDEQ